MLQSCGDVSRETEVNTGEHHVAKTRIADDTSRALLIMLRARQATDSKSFDPAIRELLRVACRIVPRDPGSAVTADTPIEDLFPMLVLSKAEFASCGALHVRTDGREILVRGRIFEEGNPE
jgi:hypothetical protein